MARRLSGMGVVITGASAGIGRALAIQLAAAGARLALSARRIERLQDLNRSLGGGHLCVQADVSREEDCARLISESARVLGRIDVLVCNAGYGIARPVAAMTRPEFQAIFDTNVHGTADCVRAAVPLLIQQEIRDGFRGQVMIVSSAAARRGLPYFGAYAATKAAQLSLSEALRVELKDQRIAVTSIHPMGTATDFFATAEDLSGRKIQNPSRRAVRQPVEAVARKMVSAIRRPVREVWPMPFSRYLLALNALIPALGDFAMVHGRRELDRMKD